MYQLAVMAGVVNVDKLGRSITAKQLLGWEDYFALEPFGETRADYRAASIREMVYNINVKREHRKPLADFLLRWGGEETKKKPWQEMKASIMMWTLLSNAKSESER